MTTKCRECGNNVSYGALICPHCGARSPAITQESLLWIQKRNRIIYSILCIILFLLIVFLIFKYFRPLNPNYNEFKKEANVFFDSSDLFDGAKFVDNGIYDIYVNDNIFYSLPNSEKENICIEITKYFTALSVKHRLLGLNDDAKISIYDRSGDLVYDIYGLTIDESKNLFSIYEASSYKVGKDIPAGEYVIFAEDKAGYAELAKDSSGELSSIITNANFTYNFILTINNGNYLTLSSCYAIPLKDDPYVDTSGDGMFRVGKHLEPGEYKLKVLDTGIDSGYYEVSKDSKNVIGSIESNENFEGIKYITVNSGQYLKLNNCYISE